MSYTPPAPKTRPETPPRPELDYPYEQLCEYMENHIVTLAGASRLTEHPDEHFKKTLAELLACAFLDGAGAMHTRLSELQFTSLPDSWASHFVKWRPEE